MPNQILNNIKSFVSLNEQEEKAFIEILEIRQLKKKEFLLEEGEVCDKIIFINSGCFRVFYNADGEETTVQFFFSDTWYTDYESFLTSNPTKENLQALEVCEIVQFKKVDLLKLYSSHPVFEKVGRVFAENAFLGVYNLYKMKTNDEPEQRYLNLLKQRPEVVEKIPQHYIASYLGIKPESLSRIRSRILK